MRNEVAGGLDQRVRLERRVGGFNRAGGVIEDWELVAERWAAIAPVRPGGAPNAQGEILHMGRQWKARLRAGLALTSGMRLMWRGRALLVVSVLEDPAVPDLVQLLVEDLGV